MNQLGDRDLFSGERPPSRVVIERVAPRIDCGGYAVKRHSFELFTVSADIFSDGQDPIRSFLEFTLSGKGPWERVPMSPLGNDRWEASFSLPEMGLVRFRISAWIDCFFAFSDRIQKKYHAGQETGLEYEELVLLIRETADRTFPGDFERLSGWAAEISGETNPERRLQIATNPEMIAFAGMFPDPGEVSVTTADFKVLVERRRASVGSWYEFFPRSASPDGSRAGRLEDAIEKLSEISAMGFDVIYPGPIFPIGTAFRKGANNNPSCLPGEPGSPWAIGAETGGHMSIHPELGTMDDFSKLVERAKSLGMEVAMELALQCSPDHPYVKEHPEWFRKRPDGSIHYAENPPKKYQDIYPFDFYCDQWKSLWEEMLRILLFWGEKGVRIFRVDNPHTKPFAFWEWLLENARSVYPDMVFLAEAFTRPNVMYQLAKIGFSQSYTYFTWRNSKSEIIEYVTELTSLPVKDFFRPNFWPNTPDILHEYLQKGGPPAFLIRFVLAATLSSSYGIFGPSFERCVARPVSEGSEEYLDSEKYEIRHWGASPPHDISKTISRINRIRKMYPALLQNEGIRFLPIEDDRMIAYLKPGTDGSNDILVIVTLDPFSPAEGWLSYHPDGSGGSFRMKNLMDDSVSDWTGPSHLVRLDPFVQPFMIFSREY